MSKKKSSLDWLVAARGYAMLGVFLVHLMWTYYGKTINADLLLVLQYIEPAIIPFFAILTGAFYTRSKGTFKEYAKLKFSQLMYPVYFFIIPYATNKQSMILIAILCYTVGWLYNHYVFEFPPVIGYIGMLWLMNTALIFCMFFLVGALLKPTIKKMFQWSNSKVIFVGMVSLAIMVVGIKLNEFVVPPENSFRKLFPRETSALSCGQLGHYLWFLMSSLGGAMALLCICRLIPVTRFMRACGDYSLILLGLNGIFFCSLNAYLAQWFKTPENTIGWLLLYTITLATASMAFCLPIAMALQKYLPQLTGKPMLNGPILPALYKKGSKTAARKTVVAELQN